jgi:hypothetical protein
MSIHQLTFFKEEALAKSLIRLQDSPIPQDFYAALDEVVQDPASVLRMEWDLNGDQAPVLEVLWNGNSLKPGIEAANAIKVFEYLGNLTPVQASDRRLWSYLSAVTFAEYTRSRWSLESERSWQNRAARRWLMPRGNRAELVRNSIARLWWAAKLTHDPAVGRPLSAGDGDPYAYLKTALATEDAFIAVFDRDTGMVQELRFALLEHFADAKELPQDYVRALLVEIVLVTGYRELSGLSEAEVREVVSSAAERAADT